MRLAVLLVVFVSFTAWTLTIVAGQGFAGLFSLLGREPWAAQLLVDLSLSLLVAWSWLRHDARARGIAAWPYLVATVAVGSVAVLAYLIHRELAGRRLPAAGVRG
jgi:hypothetical protein